MPDKMCRLCVGGVLKYEADVASPGSGQYWRCKECNEPYIVIGTWITRSSDYDPTCLSCCEV